MKDRILEIVAPMLGVTPSEIDLNREFQDDLEKQDVLMAIEDEFVLEFTLDESDEITNLADIFMVLERRTSAEDGESTESQIVSGSPTVAIANGEIQSALLEAELELKKPYYSTDPNKILHLGRFGGSAEEELVKKFLIQSFEALRVQAKAAAEPDEKPMVNTVAYSALVNLVAMMGRQDLVPFLIEEFRFAGETERSPADGIRRHYELIIISGDIAIALAKLGYKGDISFMNSFMSWCEGRYDNSDFFLKMKYLEWIKNGDSAAAMEYLEKQEKGIAFAVAALADMHAAQSISVIQSKLESHENPIFHEICREAINRLKTQTVRPEPQNLMIHLFGLVTPTELALGANTDNVFVQRARKRAMNSEVGQVTESDDSNLND